jgi:hypothetical protein
MQERGEGFMSRRLTKAQQVALKAAVACMLTTLGSADADQPPTLSGVTVSATVVNEEAPVIEAQQVTSNTPTEQAVGENPFKMSTHVTCMVAYLAQQRGQGADSDMSDPIAPLTVPIPIAYANPIDMSNTSSQVKLYGGTSGTRDNMAIFPNVADGIGAAFQSVVTYSGLNFNVAGLVNTWAPPPQNPNAQANVAAGLGITTNQLSSIRLKDLSAAGLYDVIAAFAWQEGMHMNGC